MTKRSAPSPNLPLRGNLDANRALLPCPQVMHRGEGHHGGVVGGEFRRREMQLPSLGSAEFLKPFAESAVGSDSSGDGDAIQSGDLDGTGRLF